MKKIRKSTLLRKHLTLQTLLAKNPITAYKKLQKEEMVKRQKKSVVRAKSKRIRIRRSPSKRPRGALRRARKSRSKGTPGRAVRGTLKPSLSFRRKGKKGKKRDGIHIKRRVKSKIIPPSRISDIYYHSFR